MHVEVQFACDGTELPGARQVSDWVKTTLREYEHDAELTVRVVDEHEGATLNARYRHKEGATNVLSFSLGTPPGIPERLIGDIAICAPVVAREAREQSKDATAHWAHMVVHGTLHLLGYDHQTKEQADEMESREIRLLAGLGFPHPYPSPGCTDNDKYKREEKA